MTSVSSGTDSRLSGRGLIRSAGWMTGSHLLAQCFAYGSLILLARWLAPASFGTIAVGTAVLYVAVLFVEQGTLGGIIVRRRLTRSDLVAAMLRCLLTAVVLGAVMAGVAGLLVDRFASGGDAAAVAALALCLPLHALAVVPTALLQKTMQFGRLAALNAIANVVSALVAVLIAVAGAGVWALVARQVVLFLALAVLTPLFCRHVRLDDAGSGEPPRGAHAERWFFLFGLALMVTANLDFLVVGAYGDAAVVGLYALAFTIAMAPSTHISAQVGKVLFAAAALHPETSRERTEQSVRLMSAVFLPLLPLGILVAPAVLPAVLGEKWQPMVVPFQILLVAGVLYAIVNCIGEALSGNGHIGFRAKAMVGRCGATGVALLVLVPLDGMRGAAIAQVIVFALYAALYATAGARRAGTSPAALWRSLRPVVGALAAQVAVSVAVLCGLVALGMPAATACALAGLAGLAVYVPRVVRR